MAPHIPPPPPPIMSSYVSSHTRILNIHSVIASLLLKEDGLAVLGEGMGTVAVLAIIMHVHYSAATGGTMLIVGAREGILEDARAHLKRIDPRLPVPPDVTADMPLSERNAAYAGGGALFATSRILAADLLTGRLPPKSVRCVVVMDAHRVVTRGDACGESFVVRLCREAHVGSSSASAVRVLALSDRPQALTGGLGKVERALKALSLRRLYLWPRFQSEVHAELGSPASAPEPVSVPCVVSPLTQRVYGCIVDVFHTSVLAAFKAAFAAGSRYVDASLLNSLSEVGAELVTGTRGAARVARELSEYMDSRWSDSTFPRRLKQAYLDALTLRALYAMVSRVDASAFLEHLEQLRATERANAVWLYADGADVLYEAASARVSSHNGNLPEPDPKWNAFLGAIEECTAERARLQASWRKRHARAPASSTFKEPPRHGIFVVCDGEARVQALQALLGCVDVAQCPNASSGAGAAAPASSVSLAQAMERGLAMALEMQAETRKRRKAARDAARIAARRRAAHGQRGGNLKRPRAQAMQSDSSAQGTHAAHASSDAGHDAEAARAMRLLGCRSVCTDVHWVASPAALARSLAAPEGDDTSFVVLYDPTPASVRAVELWAALRHAASTGSARAGSVAPALPKPRVYLLLADGFNGGESARFEAAVMSERDAFVNLIREKEHLAAPVSADGRAVVLPVPAGLATSIAPRAFHGATDTSNDQTRRAGGQASRAAAGRPAVVVDMREFSSSLPAVLHASGFAVLPATLEVGDYVLSPDICVERKSLPDLRQSLQSGRLHQQLCAMERHYESVLLLVEYRDDWSGKTPASGIGLLTSGEVGGGGGAAGARGDDGSGGGGSNSAAAALKEGAFQPTNSGPTEYDLQSRLTLLVLHHPRLRILWVDSNASAASMFAALKAGREQPSADVAAAVGSTEGGAMVDSVASEFLRRLPGIGEGNVRAVMRAAESLYDLGRLVLEGGDSALRAACGGARPFEALREFMMASTPTAS
ncbi:DNA repair endonuclease XPF [Pycnococcus provasolii]